MKFRIVRDNDAGFEVQLRYFGFYRQLSGSAIGLFGTNTRSSIEEAEELIQKYCKYTIEEKARKKKGKTVKIVEVTNGDLLQWRLQGKV